MLNFPVNQRLFYALATGDIEPLVWALEQTKERPKNAQWVQFLRSHDELDLGRLRVAICFADLAGSRGARPRLLMVWSEERRTPCTFPICEFPPDEAFAIRLDREVVKVVPSLLGAVRALRGLPASRVAMIAAV